MRIALVAPLVAPLRAAQAGGAQVVLCDLARGLVARGEEVEVLAAPGSRVPGVRVRVVRGGLFPEARVHAAAAVGAAAGGPSASTARPPAGPRAGRPAAGTATTLSEDLAASWPAVQAAAYLGVAASLRAARPDVVHAHALDWPAFYALAAAGLPTVHTLHLGPLDPAAAAAARAAAGSAPRPRFVAVSRACRAQWRGVVGVDAVIGNGVDPAVIPFSATPQRDLALVAGRIAPEKGTHLAIAAALRAGMRVALAGGVYDRAYFEEKVEPLLGPRVENLGPLAHRRLAALYGRAAVAVVASLWEEPFGMVAVEANLAGTPVAGFARGALPEVVGAVGGVLTATTTADALAEAIAAAISRDRRRVRAAAARRHPVERMVDRYLDLYRRAAGGRA
jgi:glycosyltransferase involved in cell wall biosynthesis